MSIEVFTNIFLFLLTLAKTSHDTEGAVAACLVRDDRIFLSSPSADDMIRHAEDLIIEQAKKKGITIRGDDVLLTTVEPCSERSPERHMIDCTSLIIQAGIKHVIYAAIDPYQHEETKRKCREADVELIQVHDKSIQENARNLFNATQHNPKKRKL